MDSADITALNDFTEEIVTRTRHQLSSLKPLERGTCLNCGSRLGDAIYCDDDCRRDFEDAELIRKRTYR